MTAVLTETTHNLTTRLGAELTRPEAGRPALRHLGRAADALAELSLSTWTWVRETLEEGGFEARELARHCRVVLDGIDGSLAAHERLRARAEAVGMTAADAGLDRLEARLASLRETRPLVAQALSLAERPSRPVDESRLAEARSASERGEFVTIDDDYLARLRAGGDF